MAKLQKEEVRHIFIGDSKKNVKHPANSQKVSPIAYLKLLVSVIWTEFNTFYSLYFVVIGLLEFIPEISTANAWMTLLPLLLVFIFEFLVQAWDLFSAQKSIKSDDRKKYNVTRDHITTQIASKNIKPGDLVEISDQSTVPCDCLLIHTDQMCVFVNTAKIDGETDVKDKTPISLPNGFNDEIIKNAKAYVIDSGKNEISQKIEGVITFTEFQEKNLGVISLDENQNGTYYKDQNGNISSPFNIDSFIERGSFIESSGNHLLLALYTGSDCRSDTSIRAVANRKTLINNYLEKISMFIFIFQLIISIILGTLGYLSLSQYSQTYVPKELLHDELKGWMALIVIIRNFLLLSFMVPITLKILLPIFRFIYGIFISKDSNFESYEENGSEERNGAEALSTNITENLGALDVVLTDKTGTLTKNQLTLVSLSIGNYKFGNTRKAPTILEDQELHNLINKGFSNNSPSSDSLNLFNDDLIMTFHAMSTCHTIKIDNDQKLHGSSADELAIITALQKLGWKFTQHEKHYRNCETPIGNYELKILKVNSFNRRRMRMSVVVQLGDATFVFMKGASEFIKSNCTSFSGDQALRYEELQKEGLRTLSFSFKQIEYYDPNMDLNDLESNHRFLATVGIEDSLQNDIQLTLDLLSDAGLKIWVATGDARTNTIVISCMLNLLHYNESIVEITTENLQEEAGLQISNNEGPRGFSDKAMMVPENSFSAVVNSSDNKILKLALEKKKFLTALKRARCVIFYRCKPTTKADITIALQNNGQRVLGVGDGYNDSLMLRSADVGIGIKSPDGSKAFASCDFAIPAFRNLGRLILIHGHQSLHRSVLAVHFSFYKAVMFATCQSLYQIWTQFSGQSLFDEFALFCFNNIWTLLPIISLLFEKDVGENFLYRLSYLYKKLRNPLTLNPSNITWFFVAIYQGAVIIVILWALTGEGYYNSSGKDFGARYLSLILYFSMVIISSFYMLYQTNTFTYYSIVLIFGNILMLIASSAIFQSDIGFEQADTWIGFYGECFNNINTLIIILTIVLAAVSPSWLGLSIWQEYQNSDSLRVIETETNAAKNDEPLFFDPPNAK